MLNFEDNIRLTKYQYSENLGQKVQPKYGSGARARSGVDHPPQ